MKIRHSIVRFVENYNTDILIMSVIGMWVFGYMAKKVGNHPNPFGHICLFCFAACIISFVAEALYITAPIDRKKEGEELHETQTLR